MGWLLRDQQRVTGWGFWSQPAHSEAKISPVAITISTTDMAGLPSSFGIWLGQYYRIEDTREYYYFFFFLLFSSFLVIEVFIFIFALFYSSSFPLSQLFLLILWYFHVSSFSDSLWQSFAFSIILSLLTIFCLPVLLLLCFSSFISLFYLLSLLSFLNKYKITVLKEKNLYTSSGIMLDLGI